MFKFKIVNYEGEDNFETYTGFVPGTTYGEAFRNLTEEAFIESNIVSLTLEFVTQSNVLYVSEDMANTIKEKNDI